MAAKIIDGEQIMWMRLQGNADAMHMLQTSHAFWVGPPLFGWGDFTLLSWANSKSLCNSTNMRLNCLFPWYLATFGTTASPTLASQTFLKAAESFWAWVAFWAGGWGRPQQGFFSHAEGDWSREYDFRTRCNGKAGMWFWSEEILQFQLYW